MAKNKKEVFIPDQRDLFAIFDISPGNGEITFKCPARKSGLVIFSTPDVVSVIREMVKGLAEEFAGEGIEHKRLTISLDGNVNLNEILDEKC